MDPVTYQAWLVCAVNEFFCGVRAWKLEQDINTVRTKLAATSAELNRCIDAIGGHIEVGEYPSEATARVVSELEQAWRDLDRKPQFKFSGAVARIYHEQVVEKKDAEIAILRADLARFQHATAGLQALVDMTKSDMTDLFAHVARLDVRWKELYDDQHDT